MWYPKTQEALGKQLPLVASEVIVSEGAKSIRGSIGVLEAVSPALGIVIVQDDDIARRLRSAGHTEEYIARALSRTNELVEDHIRCTRQRIEIWTYKQLGRRHEVAMRALAKNSK